MLCTFDSKYVPELKPDSSRDDVENAIKYNFAFCAVEDAGEKVTFDSILNSKTLFTQF
jgi:hypothetical protein